MWKVYLMVGIIGVSAYLLALGRTRLDWVSPREAIGFQIASLIVFIASQVYICIAVRCPTCGARWVYMSLGATIWSKWVDWLVKLERCPRCEGPHTVV
jgi:hypothetical protein